MNIAARLRVPYQKPKTHLKYRPDVDGLRAIAVGSVVLYHAFPERAPGGFIGVDIFFVISGYLITTIILDQLSEGTFSIWSFYGRRVRRIFPALIVVALLTFAFGWFVLSVNEFKSLGASLVGSATFMQNFVLLNEVGYFDVEGARKPLLHIWSLGIEEQYYIVWPAVLIAVSRFRLNIVTVVSTLTVASFWFSLFILKRDQQLAFYLPFSRSWELLAGSELAMAVASAPDIPLAKKLEKALATVLFERGAPCPPNIMQHVLSLISLAVIVFATVHFNSQLNFPGLYALIPVAAAMLLIVCKQGWANQHILGSEPMVFIGLISYPLYLWHYPLTAYVRDLSPDGVSRTTMIAVVTVSLILAWLTFEFIERPLRFRLPRRAAISILIGGMCLIGALGILAYSTDGLPIRIPVLRPFMLTGRETSAHWRRKKCLLLPNQDASAFTDECAGRGRHPLIFLWGDSYAAAQYPGLASLRQEGGFDVAEFTSSACPPMIGFVDPTRRFCKGNNDFVLERIGAIRPEIVVLHSTWQYDQAALEQGLFETVQRLRTLSVRKIVLLGPVPAWKGAGLPANMIDYYYEHALQLLPARTTYRLVEDDREERLRKIAETLGIQYVSVLKVMCNEAGCLARIGANDEELTAFDGGHMTLAGSTFLAKAILPELLEGVK
jgi:peptidoglycan/LPS O-acetylase OafA/YrhL